MAYHAPIPFFPFTMVLAHSIVFFKLGFSKAVEKIKLKRTCLQVPLTSHIQPDPKEQVGRSDSSAQKKVQNDRKTNGNCPEELTRQKEIKVNIKAILKNLFCLRTWIKSG